MGGCTVCAGAGMNILRGPDVGGVAKGIGELCCWTVCGDGVDTIVGAGPNVPTPTPTGVVYPTDAGGVGRAGGC